MKERDNARGQRVEKNTEEEQKEGPLPLRTEPKNDERRQEQSISVAQMLGIERKGEEVQEAEEKSFPDGQWNEKEGKEGRAKKKKAGRKDDQALADKEEGKKKKIRSFARKRGRRKGPCELSEERGEREKEGNLWRKLKAESADNASIWDTDL